MRHTYNIADNEKKIHIDGNEKHLQHTWKWEKPNQSHNRNAYHREDHGRHILHQKQSSNYHIEDTEKHHIEHKENHLPHRKEDEKHLLHMKQRDTCHTGNTEKQLLHMKQTLAT